MPGVDDGLSVLLWEPCRCLDCNANRRMAYAALEWPYEGYPSGDAREDAAEMIDAEYEAFDE